MAIPNYQECMLPLLEIVADGADHAIREVTGAIADPIVLSVEEPMEFPSTGQPTMIANA